MRISLIALPMVALAVSGCKLVQDQNTHSSFASVSSSGIVSTDISGQTSYNEIDGSGDGFAYIAGTRTSTGLKAASGLVSGTDVVTPPISGGATYSGRYEMRVIDGIYLTGDQIGGFANNESGSITLTADFNSNTLKGQSGQLSVDGTLSGETLGGKVTYRGERGSLRGLVGSDKAVGAFHGNSADIVYAGGFLAPRASN